MKVLVVDDDVVSRMVLMHLIDSCGNFDIVEAEDGADAWRQLEAGLRPLICFCDLRMPQLSGMDLLLRVKRHPGLEAMPFVLVSSAAERETAQRAASAGAAGYVVKPFEAYQVRAHLTPLLAARDAAPAHRAEAPHATWQRLGIDAERLHVYLSGFLNQLTAASSEICALLAAGRQAEARARIERLHAGSVTLGLSGAAEALAAIETGTLAGEPVQAVLTEVARAVIHQIGLARQDSGVAGPGEGRA
jgi:two-component system chemotaxis response regulator CheY